MSKKQTVSEDTRMTSLRNHPEAGPSIRRAKGAAGLAGFVLGAFIGTQNGSPFAALILRATEVGIGASLVVWAAALMIWKRVLIARASGALERRRQNAAEAATE